MNQRGRQRLTGFLTDDQIEELKDAEANSPYEFVRKRAGALLELNNNELPGSVIAAMFGYSHSFTCALATRMMFLGLKKTLYCPARNDPSYERYKADKTHEKKHDGGG